MENIINDKQTLMLFIEKEKHIIEEFQNLNIEISTTTFDALKNPIKASKMPPKRPPPPSKPFQKPEVSEVLQEEESEDFSFDAFKKEENCTEKVQNAQDDFNFENSTNTEELTNFSESAIVEDFDDNFSNFIATANHDVDKLKKVLKKKFKLPKNQIEPFANELALMDEQTFNEFMNYANTGIMKNLQVRQYFLFDLIQKHNFEVLSAYLMISGLRKNFDKYELILKKKIGG